MKNWIMDKKTNTLHILSDDKRYSTEAYWYGLRDKTKDFIRPTKLDERDAIKITRAVL